MQIKLPLLPSGPGGIRKPAFHGPWQIPVESDAARQRRQANPLFLYAKLVDRRCPVCFAGLKNGAWKFCMIDRVRKMLRLKTDRTSKRIGFIALASLALEEITTVKLDARLNSVDLQHSTACRVLKRRRQLHFTRFSPMGGTRKTGSPRGGGKKSTPPGGTQGFCLVKTRYRNPGQNSDPPKIQKS